MTSYRRESLSLIFYFFFFVTDFNHLNKIHFIAIMFTWHMLVGQMVISLAVYVT